MSFVAWSAIAALIALNAMYVAAEFAGVAVRRSELTLLFRRGNSRAAAVLDLLQDGASLDRYIAACQIGITLSSLVAGAYAQGAFATDLAPVLELGFGLEAFAARTLAAIIVLLVLTSLQVVLGELLPKSIALQFPERTALLTFVPLRWSVSAFRAFIWLLNGSGNLLLRPFGVKPSARRPHVHSRQELELLFAESSRGGTLTPELHRRLQRGLRLSQRSIRQLMVPRSKLIAIEASTPDDEILRLVLASPYSRFPVYRGTLDRLLGSVSTKDIVGWYVESGTIPPLSEILRPMPLVPDKLTADRLVRLLQQERTSKAIVVDEYGGVQGMISIDDLLMELFGDLGDDHKLGEQLSIETLPDGRVKLPGSMRPAAAEAWFGETWESTAATLSGLIVSRLGRLPAVGEQIELGGVEVTVLGVTSTTIAWLAVRPRLARAGLERGA